MTRAGRISILAVSVLGLVLVLAGWTARRLFSRAPAADDAQTHWHAAQEAIAAYQFSEAAVHLTRCLESWPYNAEAHFLMARTSRRGGNLVQWKIHLDRADILRWPKKQIELERQLRRAQVGDIFDVETSLLDLANTLPPDEVIILEALVNGYMENDCLLDVVALTTTWIQRYPEDWLPLIYRGNAQLRLYGKPAEAVKDFQRVLELKPEIPATHLALAQVLTNDGQFNEAAPHFQYCLDHQPEDPIPALFGLATCQYSMGKTELARETLGKLQAQVKNHSGAIFLQAKIELAEGRPEDALQSLKKADGLSHDQADVTNALVHVSGQLGLEEEMVRYQRRLEDIQKRDELLDRLVSEAKLRPDDPDVRFQLATTCLKYGREDEASHWFQGILYKDPKHLPTLKTLADYYESKGKPKLADRYRKKAASASGKGSGKSTDSAAR